MTLLKKDKETTYCLEYEKWDGGFEKYSFIENNSIKFIIVEADNTEEYIDRFKETWPNAIKKLNYYIES